MSSVAIAILNYNGEHYLKQFLPTLVHNSPGATIYVGDNASTDGSAELLKSTFPEVKCIRLEDNYGYSKGYNMLLEQVEEEYIVLVNSDIEVTENWLIPLIQELEVNPMVAAVQPKIKSFNNKELFEYAGAAGGFVDKYGVPFCRGRLFDALEKDNGQYDDSIEIKWASGACFMIRKSAFNRVSGFDDDFFAHMEEIDLCWRLFNAGFKVKYVPLSVVYHVGGGTLSYSSPFKTFLNYRNGLYLLMKNLPTLTLRQTIIMRVVQDWLSVLYHLLKGNWKLARAILKAHLEVLKNRDKFLAKRANLAEKSFTENYSVVWQYFVKGKKQYSQLDANQ